MSSFKRCGLLAALVAARTVLAGRQPAYPYDPNTASNCVWWYDNDGAEACEAIVADNWLTIDDFRQMNPSVSQYCTGLKTGQSYCVEVGAGGGTPITTTTTSSTTSSKPTSTSSATKTTFTTTKKPSTTPTPTPSPTQPANGITTPEPIQANMVNNCDKFYFVKKGEGCNDVLSKNGITLDQFYKWNPSVGSNCAGLWAEVNVCVSIIGHTPTTTKPGNGIATPTPTQPDMVGNCDKFYFVPKGETCDKVASKNGISVAELAKFNPSVGSNCAGLWADTYACVSIVGHTPGTPTTGNGVATPSPIQPGMVTNCKTFHFVDGSTCQAILDRYKISLANFTKWNSQIGNNCQSMWNKTYVCVAVL